MAATVNTRQLNGTTPGSPSTIAAIYMQTSEQAAQDTTNILMRPLAGNYYSFWMTVYLNAESSPVTTINNVKIYSSGASPWTGVTLYVGDETTSTYVQATGTVGQTGSEMVANHGQITARTDMNTYTSGSPKSVSGSISNPNTGRISDYVVLQCEVGTGATPGPLTGQTLTWRYDET